MRTFAGLLLALLPVGTASAEFLLIPASSTVAAGGAVEVTLFVPNDSPQADLGFNLPARLTLRARGAGSAPDIVLKPVDGQQMRVSIKPGGYLRARYSGPLPAGLVGNLVLEPVDFEGSALGLTATATTAPSPEKSLTAHEDDNDSAAAAAIGPSEKDSARIAAAFSPYEPNYFSGGSSGTTNAKFQISMKFRLFNPETQTPFLEKLYLAYSQTSIWAIGSSSKPFYDSSYRPSVFFLDEDVSQWPWRKTSRLGFQAGIEHESNGKDGDNSRSIMIAYVRPTFSLPFAERYFVSISPKIYTYLEKEDNPDIPYYRGYSDVLVKVGQTDGMQLASTLRKGTGEDPYSVELDLSYPLKIARLGNLGGYLHLQYFNGYGESLIDYNHKVRPQFRVGLMITR